MATPNIIRISQIFGITSSAFISGFAFPASFYAIPAALLAPPALRVRQWAVVYNMGKLIAPTFGVASAVTWFSLAYRAYSQQQQLGQLRHGVGLGSTVVDTVSWGYYAAAGMLTLATVVWTGVAIAPVNGFLLKAVEKVEKGQVFGAGEEKAVVDAVEKWNTVNWPRAVFPMAGAAVGLWGLLA